MLLDLPLELLQKCVQFAIFPQIEEIANITHSPPTPENKKALQSLLLLPAPILGHFIRQVDNASGALCTKHKRPRGCHVPPRTVHLIHDNRGQYNDNDIYTAALTTVFRNLFALKALSTAPASYSDHQTAALSVCPLTSLSCRFSSELVSPQPRDWKLVSLTLWGIPVTHELLSPFLEEQAGTLQELGLGFWRRYTRDGVRVS